VIEEAVILVIVEDQRGLRPHLRVGRERRDHTADQDLAERYGRVGMLAHLHHRHDPRHRRQPVGGDVRGERGDQVLGLRLLGIFWCHAVDPVDVRAPATVMRRRPVQLSELAEIAERIVRIIGNLLVHAPGNSRLLESTCIGAPRQALRRVVLGHVGAGVGIGAAVGDAIDAVLPDAQAVRAAEMIEPVGAGRALQRAVIAVADRELVRQCMVIGDVGAGQVRHRQRALLLRPDVPIAPARLAVLPAMVEARETARVAAVVVEPERPGDPPAIAVGAALRPDRSAAGQRHRARIRKAAHAPQRTEIMIERPVFLHQNHDVLDVHDRATRNRTP